MHIDLSRPMSEIRATLSKYPVKTRLASPGRWWSPRHRPRQAESVLDTGEPMPEYLRDYMVYYAGPAKTPEGYASGLVRSDDRRTHGRLCRFFQSRAAAT